MPYVTFGSAAASGLKPNELSDAAINPSKLRLLSR